MSIEVNTYDLDAPMTLLDMQRISKWLIEYQAAQETGKRLMPPQMFQEAEDKGKVIVKIDDIQFLVNPQQMNWSKAYKIEENEIVYRKDISQWMGSKLWVLTMSLKTFTEVEKDFLWYLGDEDGTPGPHMIEAAIPSGGLCMYLKNKTGQQVEGESDSVWYWTLTLIEAHDGGI